MYVQSVMWCDTHDDIAAADSPWACRSAEDGARCLWERVVLVPTSAIKMGEGDFHFGLGERWQIKDARYTVEADHE